VILNERWKKARVAREGGEDSLNMGREAALVVIRCPVRRVDSHRMGRTVAFLFLHSDICVGKFHLRTSDRNALMMSCGDRSMICLPELNGSLMSQRPNRSGISPRSNSRTAELCPIDYSNKRVASHSRRDTWSWICLYWPLGEELLGTPVKVKSFNLHLKCLPGVPLQGVRARHVTEEV
jgi:hypothetical protein